MALVVACAFVVPGPAGFPSRQSSQRLASFMTDTTVTLRDYQASRWRKLAEQRLEHVTELFVSGRWQRYFGERDFLEIVRQSKDAVAAWRKLEFPREVDPRLPGASFAAPELLTDKAPARVDERSRFAAESSPLEAPTGFHDAPIEPPLASDAGEEVALVSVAAVANLRRASLLPSPFEDAMGPIALQRLRRAQ
jgi:uncharacterized repeat protein (TIGR03809 family)